VRVNFFPHLPFSVSFRIFPYREDGVTPLVEVVQRSSSFRFRFRSITSSASLSQEPTHTVSLKRELLLIVAGLAPPRPSKTNVGVLPSFFPRLVIL